MAAFVLLGCLLPAGGQTRNTPGPNKRPVDYANALVGTVPLDDQKLIGNAPPPGEQLYSGFTSPGAELPHSSTDIAPINANLRFEYTAGVPSPYYYPNQTMVGFSSGEGGEPTLMPVVGDWTVPPARSVSVYDKKREKSAPGFYSVYLDTYKTGVEMTATTWTGLYRFTFPATEKAHVLLDLGEMGGDVEVVGDHIVRGQVQRGRPGHRRGGFGDMYFVAEFSKPFKNFGAFRQIPPPNGGPSLGDKDVEANTRTVSGHYAGTYLQFTTTPGEQVLVKIAHGRSYAMAEERLRTEDPGWDFDRVRKQAEAVWASKLDRIEVKGGTEKEKMLFYSCLLHTFASPRLVAKKGEQFTGLDGKEATAAYDRYDAVPYLGYRKESDRPAHVAGA